MPDLHRTEPDRSAGSTLGMMTTAFNGLPSLPLKVLGDRHPLLFPS